MIENDAAESPVQQRCLVYPWLYQPPQTTANVVWSGGTLERTWGTANTNLFNWFSQHTFTHFPNSHPELHCAPGIFLLLAMASIVLTSINANDTWKRNKDLGGMWLPFTEQVEHDDRSSKANALAAVAICSRRPKFRTNRSFKKCWNPASKLIRHILTPILSALSRKNSVLRSVAKAFYPDLASTFWRILSNLSMMGVQLWGVVSMEGGNRSTYSAFDRESGSKQSETHPDMQSHS